MRENLSDEEAGTILWALPLICFLSLSKVRGAVLRGLRHVVQGQFPEMFFRPAVMLALSLGLLTYGSLTPSHAMASYMISALLAFLLGSILLWRVLPTGIEKIQPVYERKEWLKSILPLSLIAGMQVVNHQVDMVLLGILRSNDSVGVYKVATQMVTLVGFSLTIINSLIAPQISRLYQSGEMRKLQNMITLCSRLMVATAFPVAMAFLFFGESIIGFVFGEEYGAGNVALLILSLGQVVNAAMGSVAYILNMTGHDQLPVLL